MMSGKKRGVLIPLLFSLVAFSSNAIAGQPGVVQAEIRDYAFGKVGHSGGFVDITGDGVEEVLVGAPDTARISQSQWFDPEYQITSKKGVLLAYGDSTYPLWKIDGDSFGDNLGYSFANLGDVDGDGVADFAVGAVFAQGHTSLSGTVSVYKGGRNPPEMLTGLSGLEAFDVFGYAITGGDLNGDGINDIIVSARQATGKYYQSGVLYVYFGGPSLSGAPDVVINDSPAVLGHHAQPTLGACLSTGDVNGDGITDLLAGDTKSVFLYYGRRDFAEHLDVDMTPDVQIKVSNCRPKANLAFIGDISGDGIGDFAIGDTRDSGRTGQLYLIKGGRNMPTEFDPDEDDGSRLFATITGENVNNLFGYSVTSVGDVDGGGVPDILVGSAWATNENSTIPVGKVYLFYGEELRNGSEHNASEAAVTYSMNLPFSEFGTALAADSRGNFFVGAPLADDNRGSAFVSDIKTGASREIVAK